MRLGLRLAVGLPPHHSSGAIATRGPELVTNGATAFSGTTGWVGNGATIGETDGELVITTVAAANFASARYTFATEVGATYEVIVTGREGTNPDSLAVVVKAPTNVTSLTNVATSTTPGSVTQTFVAPTTTATIAMTVNAASATGGTTITMTASAKKVLA